MNNFLEYEITQRNQFNLSITMQEENGDPISIEDKKLKVMLKFIDDNLNNDSEAKINREVVVTQEMKDQGIYYVSLNSLETADLQLALENKPNYNLEISLIDEVSLDFETLLQAKIKVVESIFKS